MGRQSIGPLEREETPKGIIYRRYYSESTWDEWFPGSGSCVKHEKRTGGGTIIHEKSRVCELIRQEYEQRQTR
jgi:hypothetical protein